MADQSNKFWYIVNDGKHKIKNVNQHLLSNVSKSINACAVEYNITSYHVSTYHLT